MHLFSKRHVKQTNSNLSMARKRKAVDTETDSEHKVSDKPVRKKRSRYCITEGCYVTAYFGILGQRATHCITHMDASRMNNVKDKRCEHLGCEKLNPAYGFLGESPRFCKNHQLPNMNNLKSKKCIFEGCKVMYPQWGYKGVVERYCAGHKKSDMIRFVNRLECEQEGCKVTPYFNYKGFINGRFCKTHKLENMCNVQQVTCAYPGCTSQSRAFNFKGLKGLYCSKHKIKGMINVKTTCAFEDCDLTCRKWGLPGSFGQFCDKHKDETMTSFQRVKRTCQFLGCKLTPKFGLKRGCALFCFSHRKPNMKRFEKTCLFDGCEKIALKFGNHITRRAFCSEHADRSIHWKLTTCKQVRCKQIATHSETGAFPFQYCESHAPGHFSSCKEQKCLGCNLPYLCDEEGYCLFSCTRRHKERTKLTENAMNEFFVRKGLTFTRDTAPDFSCTARRPDFEFRTAFGVVLVENDEDQHKSRVCECEQRRMMELHQSYGESVHFIRFNPDRFVQSATGKKGFVELPVRHKELYKILQSVLNRPEPFFAVHPGLSVRYLYYDNCDTSDKFNEVVDIHNL